MNKYDNYLFDLDGTLCDTAPDILKVRDAALAEHGLDLNLPQDYSFIGPPLGDIMRRFIPPQYDDAFVAQVVLSFRRLYLEAALEQSLPFPGVVETLEGLRACGKRLFVVTNKANAPTRRLLGLRGLTEYFEAVYTPDVFPGRNMKKSESIAALVADYALETNDTLYVGDTMLDVEAAHANGIDCAFFSGGYGIVDRDKQLPEYEIGHFSELPE